jgi:hypothetical protein
MGTETVFFIIGCCSDGNRNSVLQLVVEVTATIYFLVVNANQHNGVKLGNE